MGGSIPVHVQAPLLTVRGTAMTTPPRPPLERRLERILSDLDDALSRAERLMEQRTKHEQLALDLGLSGQEGDDGDE